MPPAPDDSRLDQFVQGEPARAWLARLTDDFFDRDAKQRLLAEVRAGLADHFPAAEHDGVIQHLCRLASRDARRPQPEAPPEETPLSGPELEDAILADYPFPIAAPYDALTEQQNDAARFLCLMDTFEGLVHFLATVALSAYLRSDLACAEHNRWLLERLGTPRRGWTTGELFSLLRETIRRAGGCGGLLPYPRLPGYLFTPRGEPSASHQVLESFIELRNRTAHDPGRTERVFAEVLPPNRRRLEDELARMPWLAGCALVRPVAVDDAGRVSTADLLNGHKRKGGRPFALQLRESDLARSDGPVRGDRDALLLVAPDRQTYLPLYPLALFRFQSKGAGAYLLQGCRWQADDGDPWRLERASYVCHQEGLPPHEEGPGEFAARALEKQVARLRARLPAGAPLAAVAPAPPADDPDCELPQVRVEQESHRRGFVGREDLLSDLAGWIDTHAEGGYLLLLGPPGLGKSALMAELAHREAQRGGCLLHMVKSHRQPLHFLPALIRQAARLAGTNFGADAYRGVGDGEPDVSQAAAYRRRLDNLRNSLVRALEAVRDRTGRAVVVLDALDEVDAEGEPGTFFPPELPAGVRVVLTCRPDIPLVMALRARLGRLRVQDVPPLSEADFRLFVERRLGAEAAAAVGRAADLGALFRRLDGNPLFLRFFLDEVARPWADAARQGKAGPLDVAAVPAGLDALFYQAYHGIRDGRGPGRQRARLLQLLCLAREPLTIDRLSGLLAVDGQPLSLEECRDRVEEMSQWLLDTGGGRFQPWHLGLADYIRQQVLREAGCRQVEEVFCRWLAGPSADSGSYGPRHRTRHLLAAGQFETVCDLLTDLRFLEARAEAGLVFDLAGDFALAVAQLPASHPRRWLLRLLGEALRHDLHFLGRHPSALFQCLWNRAWWYDCPAAAAHYEEGRTPGSDAGVGLHRLLEGWRAEKERREPGFVWLRSLRPLATHLGTALRAVFRGHQGQVAAVCCSPDGRRLATGSEDGTVRVWGAAGGSELFCLRGHDGPVRGVAFAPDGRTVASASWDQTVRVWDAAEGAPLLSLRGHEGRVEAVAFAPDGRTLASGSWDQTIRVWDATTGAQLHCLRTQEREVLCVAFAPDGRTLAAGSGDETVRVWDAATGARLHCLRGHEGRVEGVAFAPDGRTLASAAGDRTVRVWDTTAGIPLLCLRGHESRVESVAFAPDGRTLVSGSGDQTVRVWDAATGAPLRCHRGHESKVLSVTFAPDGRTVVSASADQTVRVWDADGAPLLSLCGHTGAVRAVAFAPDGRTVASGSWDRRVRVWDAATGAPLRCLRGHKGPVWSVAFAPDGRILASGADDWTARVWDTAEGTQILCLRGDARTVGSVAFAPDGRTFAGGTGGGTVWLWDAATGSALHYLRGHEGGVWSVAFAPDGRTLASGGDDGTVRVWDAAGGAELLCLRGHDDWVWGVAFAPDGRTLASGSGDQTVRVWDAASGACLEVIPARADARAVAAGAAFPWRAVVRGSEAAVESAAKGRPIGWFPAALRGLATHPAGRTWGGGVASHLTLFTLEGAPRD